MITGELIIQKYSKTYGWCLYQLVGVHNAESELQRLQKEFPNEQFRLEKLSKEEASNAWWNKNLD